MKPLLAALGVTAVLLGASVGFAQYENAGPAKPPKTKSHAHTDELSKAPEKDRSRRNSMESDPSAVAAGRLLFEQHCSECHGSGAEGTRRGPSLRQTEVQNASPGAIFWLMTNGIVRHGMPVWSKLPEPQRWQITSYVKSLGVHPVMPAGQASAAPQPLDSTAPSSPLR